MSFYRRTTSRPYFRTHPTVSADLFRIRKEREEKQRLAARARIAADLERLKTGGADREAGKSTSSSELPSVPPSSPSV